MDSRFRGNDGVDFFDIHVMNNIHNIAAYKFVSLDDLPARRDHFKSRCAALQLKVPVT